MRDAGNKIEDTRYRIQDTGYRIYGLDTSFTFYHAPSYKINCRKLLCGCSHLFLYKLHKYFNFFRGKIKFQAGDLV